MTNLSEKRILYLSKEFIPFCFLFLILTGCKKDNTNNNLNNIGATLTDIDGNIYDTVMISAQVWMKENLKTTHYRNGDPILTGLSDQEWTIIHTGAYAISHYTAAPEDTIAINAIYGKLYNWFAVDDPRNIAPLGWHVPTDAEWAIMVNYLGGMDVAGDKLKEAGNSHWMSTGNLSTNSSGFTALPGGARSSYDGAFAVFGAAGLWWTTSADNLNLAWYWSMLSPPPATDGTGTKQAGMSVRCIRD